MIYGSTPSKTWSYFSRSHIFRPLRRADRRGGLRHIHGPTSANWDADDRGGFGFSAIPVVDLDRIGESGASGLFPAGGLSAGTQFESSDYKAIGHLIMARSD
jgi:hypothetical protein